MYFDPDGSQTMRAIESQAMILTPEKWIRAVQVGDFPRELLPDLLTAIGEQIRDDRSPRAR